jgi:hypothetical protein
MPLVPHKKQQQEGSFERTLQANDRKLALLQKQQLELKET